MLTIISVKYGSSQWLEKNLEFSQALNPHHTAKWLIVNNDNDPNFRINQTILPAVPLVKTRFLLVLDHDFFILRRNWMDEIMQHMMARDLSFFGSVWHPKWTYQYRYFPSVHCFFVDLEKIRLKDLNFMPDMGGDWLDNIISHPSLLLPKFIRTRLQIGKFRDTGWRIYQRFKKQPFESLIPHLNASPTPFMPERLSFIPTKPDSFTRASFLSTTSSYAYRNGWEEFFWQTQPFALHLRLVGRNVIHDHMNDAIYDDMNELNKILKVYRQTIS
jgi:hypothetical protein